MTTLLPDLADEHVVVLTGGASSERAVALRSAGAVLSALGARGDGRGPARLDEVELRPDGSWLFAGECGAPEEVLARIPRAALFFLALHGGAGEDGTVQGLLAATGRAHTGSGVFASALCMEKSSARAVLSQAGLGVAPGRLVERAQWQCERARVERELAPLVAGGAAVKPDHGGSSVATTVLEGPAGLAPALEAVFAAGDRALVEARVRGVECTVGVLGNRSSGLRALAPVEIVPAEGRFFDEQQKYAEDGARELCPPRSLDAPGVQRLAQLGLAAHRATGCDGYSRTDFIVPRGATGELGEPIVLEVNTLPGLTARSLLPLAAREAGLSLRDLCLEILALGRLRCGGGR